MVLHFAIQPDTLPLAPLDRPQLGYALLSLHTSMGDHNRPTLHYALVIDASRSMRIPIVDERQFRDLVRTGGAQEILVDGVPVWQLTQPIPAEMRARTPGALDYTARALHTLSERLNPADAFTLIACAEQAEVLIAGARGIEQDVLIQGINRLTQIRLGQTTDLAQGIALGLAELAHQRPQMERQNCHLLLLTDGFTQNRAACEALAHQAAAMGVLITTLGMGGQCEHDLLITLADLTGGRAIFLPDATAIPQALAQELVTDQPAYNQSASLNMRFSQDTRLRRATRIRPELTPLEPVYQTEREVSLNLGMLTETSPTILLLELLAPPVPRATSPDPGAIRRIRLAQIQIMNASVSHTSHDLIATYTPTPAEVPPIVLQAVAYATAARLQRRAFAAIETDDQVTGITLLCAVAARLYDLGETDLATVALHEAKVVEQTGQMSSSAASELRYGMRQLGQRITIQR